MVPHYAGGHDQTTYLSRAYATYTMIEDAGLLPGLANAFWTTEAQGILLPPLASIAFLFTGPGRLGALSLNFVAFCGLQLAVGLALWRVTRRLTVVATGIGLLLATQTAFQTYGGLFDFRTDLLAVCGFGAFCALVVQADTFARRRLSLLAGVIAGLTILIRFITAPYFALTLAVFLAYLAWRLSRHEFEAKARLKHAFESCAVILVITAPVLLHNLPAINAYYLQRFAQDNSSALFGDNQPKNLLDIITFYPTSLIDDHLTLSTLIILGVLAFLCALASLRSMRQRHARQGGADLGRLRPPGLGDRRRRGVIAAVCVLNILNVTGRGRQRSLAFLALADLGLQLAVIVVGSLVVLHPDRLTEHLDLFTQPDFSDIVYAAVVAMLAYAGIEAASDLAPDVQVSRRDLKRVATLGAIAVPLVYAGMAAIALMAVPVVAGPHGPKPRSAANYVEDAGARRRLRLPPALGRRNDALDGRADRRAGAVLGRQHLDARRLPPHLHAGDQPPDPQLARQARAAQRRPRTWRS